MIFRYTSGGALVCDSPINGITQELHGETAKYYQGKYFIAESMSKLCAHKLAVCLGGDFEDITTKNKGE